MHSFDFWWRLIRPHTLSASIIPVLIGSIYGIVSSGLLKANLFFTMLFACILIQIATNLFNEYYDFKSGLDTKDSVGIGGTIVRDGASPHFVLGLAIGLYAISVLLGTYLAYKTSFIILILGLLFMLIGYLYCGGPYPISASPFGELTAGLSMGQGIVLISYYLQTGSLNWQIILLALPSTLLIAQILTANNIRDLLNDKKNGRQTLAIKLGKKQSVLYMAIIYLISYLLLPILIFSLNLSLALLLALASLPYAFLSLRTFFNYPVHKPEKLMLGMIYTAKASMLYQIGLLLGLCITLLTK